jgi:hypothetical protein
LPTLFSNCVLNVLFACVAFMILHEISMSKTFSNYLHIILKLFDFCPENYSIFLSLLQQLEIRSKWLLIIDNHCYVCLQYTLRLTYAVLSEHQIYNTLQTRHESIHSLEKLLLMCEVWTLVFLRLKRETCVCLSIFLQDNICLSRRSLFHGVSYTVDEFCPGQWHVLHFSHVMMLQCRYGEYEKSLDLQLKFLMFVKSMKFIVIEFPMQFLTNVSCKTHSCSYQKNVCDEMFILFSSTNHVQNIVWSGIHLTIHI